MALTEGKPAGLCCNVSQLKEETCTSNQLYRSTVVDQLSEMGIKQSETEEMARPRVQEANVIKTLLA